MPIGSCSADGALCLMDLLTVITRIAWLTDLHLNFVIDDGRAASLVDEIKAANADAVLIGGDTAEADIVLTPKLLKKLHELGDDAAAHFRAVLAEAIRDHDHIIVLTHVPPFHDACWHEGRLADDNWAPHFVCQAAGEALVDVMEQRPDKRMTVLCGHTHRSGRARILNQLEVLTGEAHYGEPMVQQIFEVV